MYTYAKIFTYFLLDLPVLGRLDLCAGQYDAGFEAIHQLVRVSCVTVIADYFDWSFHWLQFHLNAPRPELVNFFVDCQRAWQN